MFPVKLLDDHSQTLNQAFLLRCSEPVILDQTPQPGCQLILRLGKQDAGTFRLLDGSEVERLAPVMVVVSSNRPKSSFISF